MSVEAPRKRNAARRVARQPAAELPVARVAVDISLPHLDRPFDYLVPATMAALAVPGAQVRVRFAGQLTSGFVLDRRTESDHQGRLGYLERVVAAEPVLTPEIARLARAVADRYGGTLADVLRLAIPPRHAAASRARPPKTAPSSADGAQECNSSPSKGMVDTIATHAAADPVERVGRDRQVDAPATHAAADLAERVGRDRHVDAPATHAAADAVERVGRDRQVDAPATQVGAAEPADRVGHDEPTAGYPTSALWDRYPDGPAYLAALADGRSPRAVWSALPGQTWPVEIADAVEAVTRSGRGAVVVVPDGRDLERMDAALAARLGPRRYVVLSASLGPAERYRRWISLARGEVTVVAGTRSAMFAPVPNLGLVVLWDEGDDLHAEPRAPYPHAREVLTMRAYLSHAGALIGGFARTAEAALLVGSGWARPLAADRPMLRQLAPAVQPTGTEAEQARDEAARSARLPSIALRTARTALDSGPVLIQVPRRGYLAAVACERCHAPARCDCGGPAQLAAPGSPLRCGWCGSAVGRGCRSCGHLGLRAVVTGARRTAEELGHAFGTVPVRTSGGSSVLDRIGPERVIVVATPGAEPVADGGYSAAILLDGWAMLGLASLRAAEEALRRWMNAAALVRPVGQGGSVVVVADSAQRAVQALVRWDPATFAERELAERAELRFPPAARMAAITGPPEAVDGLLAATKLPATAELLGPLPVSADRVSSDLARVRYLVRVARPEGGELALALRGGQAIRSAAKESGAVRVQLDPAALI